MERRGSAPCEYVSRLWGLCGFNERRKIYLMSTNNNERLIKFLQATPEQQAAIDCILAGKQPVPIEPPKGPLLLGMGAAARLLGVSRATLWRMIKVGKISKVEVLRDSYRVRRADIEAIA